MIKKFIFAITFLTLFATGFAVNQPAEAANINLVIEQKSYNNAEPAPELINKRVYVPLRIISEGLGHNVVWESETASVLIDGDAATYKDQNIHIYVGGKEISTDEKTGRPWLKTPGYTMVPIRLVSEALGCEVKWYNGTVYIYNGESKGDVVLTDKTPAKAPSTSLPANRYDVSIKGDSVASLAQINKFLAQKEAQTRKIAAQNGRTFIPFPQDIGKHYLEVGAKYGIRGDIALAQAMLETGNFQYGNEVQPWQNNYCGLGATGRPVTQTDVNSGLNALGVFDEAWLVEGLYGWCYATPRAGVEAHIQHLYSYAYQGDLPRGYTKLDGRFAHGYRGIAQKWSDLNGRWAVPGNGYGERIVDIWSQMI